MISNLKHLLYRGILFINNMNKFIKIIVAAFLFLFSCFSYASGSVPFLNNATVKWDNGYGSTYDSSGACVAANLPANCTAASLFCGGSGANGTSNGAGKSVTCTINKNCSGTIQGMCRSGVVSCPANALMYSNGCFCKDGYIAQGDVCVPVCPANSMYNQSTSQCECDSGYTKQGDICIPSCPANSSYNSSTGQCDCNDGYVMEGGVCVPEPKKCKSGESSNFKVSVGTGQVSSDGSDVINRTSSGIPDFYCSSGCLYDYSATDTSGDPNVYWDTSPPGSYVVYSYVFTYISTGTTCNYDGPSGSSPSLPSNDGSGSDSGSGSGTGSGSGSNAGSGTGSGSDFGPEPSASSPDSTAGSGNGGTPSTGGNSGATGGGSGSSGEGSGNGTDAGSGSGTGNGTGTGSGTGSGTGGGAGTGTGSGTGSGSGDGTGSGAGDGGSTTGSGSTGENGGSSGGAGTSPDAPPCDPGTAQCPIKIDESGTPDGKSDGSDIDTLNNNYDKMEDIVKGAADSSDKDTSWGIIPSWFDSGECHPFSFGSIHNISVDIDYCPAADYAKGASTFIWVVGTFFAILGLVSGAVGVVSRG